MQVYKSITNSISHIISKNRISRVYIAFSGGIDSLALLYASLEVQKRCDCEFEIHLIHINHNLRGPDIAQHDKNTVYSLAEKFNFQFHIHDIPEGRIQTLADTNSEGIEAAARRIRYEILDGYASEGACILTGHHQDDQLETLIMRLSDGSGITGLKGIPYQRARYFRPFLQIPKKELEEFVHFMTEKYGTENFFNQDDSNFSNRYRRNRIRNQLIPLIDALEPGIRANLQRTVSHFKEAADLVDSLLPRNKIIFAEHSAQLRYDIYCQLHPAIKKQSLYYIFDTLHKGSGKILRNNNLNHILNNLEKKKKCNFGDFRIIIDRSAETDFLFFRPLVVQNTKKGYLNRVGSDGVLNTPVGAFDFSKLDISNIFIRSIESIDTILINGKEEVVHAIVESGLVAVMDWQVIAVLTEKNVIPCDLISGEVKRLDGDLSG